MYIKAVELHRVIELEHRNWMRPYIMLCIRLRKDANNEFEKDFFKLVSNSFWKISEECHQAKTVKWLS